MPTSIHVSPELLASVDRRAKALGLSRNRFIVRALEQEIARRAAWSPGFFEALADIAPADAQALDEMLAVIESSRTSKAPTRL